MTYYLCYKNEKTLVGVRDDAEAAKRLLSDKNAVVRIVRPYSVPTEWGMYTPAGNRRISELAGRFVLALSDNVLPTEATTIFLVKFTRLYETKTMAEASDTAVREAVLSFLERFESLIGKRELDTLWERYCD